jgi:methionyl-tRNA synthetase
MSKDLITTAISYVNGSPHIGHLYEILLADFIKRVHSLKNTTILQTGTDEHGKKIEKTAENNNKIYKCRFYIFIYKNLKISLNFYY